MPCEQCFRLAILHGYHHFIEDRSTRLFRRLCLDVLAHDLQRFLLGERSEFIQLRVDGQHLSGLVLR
ncbi:MAG: hypothetical protein R6U98_11540 [Pirellulaceae bacterium]